MNSILVFLLIAGFSLGLNYTLIQFSRQLGTVSLRNDGQERWDNSKKPIIGGISFFICFLLTCIIALYFTDMAIAKQQDFLLILTVATMGFMLGLVDDALTTKPLLKFSGQFLIGIILAFGGYQIHLFKTPLLDIPLTIFWAVGCLNSINMLDNMDGITGSVSLSIFASIFGVIYLTKDFGSFEHFLLIGLMGTLIGFLILNWNPSKLYMGDTGSQFLGAILALLGIKFLWNLPSPSGELVFTRQLLVAVLVFLAPIIDSTFVFVARIRRGQSPFIGGRDHTTHHLAFMGFSVKIIPLFYIAVTVFSSVLVYTSFIISEHWSHLFTFLFLLYISAVYLLFYISYEIGLKAKKAKTQQMQQNSILPITFNQHETESTTTLK